MQIASPSPLLPPLSITLTGGREAAPAWSNGQVIDATVVEANGDGRVLLRALDQLVEARTLLPLEIGQRLKLVVDNQGGRTLLRLVEPTAEQQTVDNAWRNALPKQLPLGGVLQALARLAQLAAPPERTAAAPAAPLPPEHDLPTAQAAEAKPSSPASVSTPQLQKLVQLAVQLLNRIATPQQLATPEGLKQALADSGLFLPNRLARGDANVAQDFQGGLLRLLSLLRTDAAPGAQHPATAREARTELPPEFRALLHDLTQQADGALARTRMHQLHNLANQNGAEPAWLVELPLRHPHGPEVLQLRIQREAGEKGNGRASGWSVRLHFDDARHGTVDCAVTLAGHSVGVNFWTERPATAHLFTQRLDELRGRLQQVGLEVTRLQTAVGTAPAAEPLVPSGLLNVSV